jgi:hypothetical protein
MSKKKTKKIEQPVPTLSEQVNPKSDWPLNIFLLIMLGFSIYGIWSTFPHNTKQAVLSFGSLSVFDKADTGDTVVVFKNKEHISKETFEKIEHLRSDVGFIGFQLDAIKDCLNHNNVCHEVGHYMPEQLKDIENVLENERNIKKTEMRDLGYIDGQ